MSKQQWKIVVAFVRRRLEVSSQYTVTASELKRKCGLGGDYYADFEKFAKSERERPFVINPRYSTPIGPLEFEFQRK
jgi:hypothetical protein